MKKKRILSIVFSIVMVIGLLPAMAFADDTSGTEGRTYNVDDGIITVTATKDGQTVKQGGETYTDSSPTLTGTSNMLKVRAKEGATAYVRISGLGSWVNTTGAGDVIIEIDGVNKIYPEGIDHAAIQKQNGGWLTLQDKDSNGTLIARGGRSSAAIGGGPSGNGSRIRITGGTIVAMGNCHRGYGNSIRAAGIGGGGDGFAEDIEISGGKVIALANKGAAAIGGGYSYYGYGGDCRNITISGGEVFASAVDLPLDGAHIIGDTESSQASLDEVEEYLKQNYFSLDYYPKTDSGNYGSIGGAGIGAGVGGDTEGITITGGTVVAMGGDNGINGSIGKGGSAGIGGSTACLSGNYFGGDASDITITGGDVTAMGGASGGAGIGSGACGSVDGIVITGGTVKATGGSSGPGIGCGLDDSSKKAVSARNITITGGDVTARGGFGRAAGIGSGTGSSAYNITITGGTVDAMGSERYYYDSDAKALTYQKTGPGIGCGGSYKITSVESPAVCKNISITGGTVTAVGSAGIGCGLTEDFGEYDADAVCSDIKISGDAKVIVKSWWFNNSKKDVFGACIGTTNGVTGTDEEGAGTEIQPDTSELTPVGYIRYYSNGDGTIIPGENEMINNLYLKYSCNKTVIEGKPTTTILGKYINISKCSVKLAASSYTYSGKTYKPAVTVTYDGKGLMSDDYTVTYDSGCKNVGKYKVTVNGKGENCAGTKTLYFTINPKATAVSKLTKGTKSFKASWSKVSSQATGYQLQYALDSKFTKSKKTVTITSYKTTSKTISKLTAKKKYYVKIRTYKKVGDATYYSAWSKAKTVTTK